MEKFPLLPDTQPSSRMTPAFDPWNQISAPSTGSCVPTITVRPRITARGMSDVTPPFPGPPLTPPPSSSLTLPLVTLMTQISTSRLACSPSLAPVGIRLSLGWSTLKKHLRVARTYPEPFLNALIVRESPARPTSVAGPKICHVTGSLRTNTPSIGLLVSAS